MGDGRVLGDPLEAVLGCGSKNIASLSWMKGISRKSIQ